MEPGADLHSGSSGDRIRTCGLEGMNLVSFLTAPPRDSAGSLRLCFVCLCLSCQFLPPIDGRAYSGGPTNDQLCHVHLPALGAE